MIRKLLMVGGAGLVVLVLVGLAASIFIDVDQFRPALERNFESAVGRNVSLGKLRLELLAGNVSVENVSIADDAKFGATPFVTARAVKVAVELWPLIASRTLRVRSFTLEEPQILLRRSPSGTWNFSTVGAPSAATPGERAAAKSQGVPSLTIGRLAVSGGRITVVSPGARHRDRIYSDVNFEATGVSYASPFPFRLDSKTPGG